MLTSGNLGYQSKILCNSYKNGLTVWLEDIVQIVQIEITDGSVTAVLKKSREWGIRVRYIVVVAT